MPSLGKYRLTGVLGRGGMGEVYAAEDTLLHRRVAVKLLSASTADDPQALERFLREARSAAKLNHPHVVAIHEIDRREKRWYIVLELVPGGSLQDKLKQSGAVPWREATANLADACRGVAAAHAAGLVHRDIKPANLMLAQDGRVKVADFGLAKSAEETAQLTTAGAVIGTPYYMAPEQWRSETPNELTDIYALGATYYSLLTGKPPHSGKDPMQVMYACCSGAALDPRDVVPEIPEACAEIVRRATAKEPSDRYASVAELQDDCEALLTISAVGGLAPSATAIPTTSPTAKTVTLHIPLPVVSRRRILSIAAGVALVVLLIAGATFWRLRGNPSNHPARPSGEWQALFDGKSLDGWTPRIGAGGPVDATGWSIEGGAIVGRGLNRPGQSAAATYLYTNRGDFTDFDSLVEVKINAGGNGGIYFRSLPNDSLPNGYECQIGVNDLGNLNRQIDHAPPAKGHSMSLKVQADEWITLHLVARGRRLEIRDVNDKVLSWVEEEENPVRTPDQTGKVPTKGHFVIQAFDENTVISVRRIDWRPL